MGEEVTTDLGEVLQNIVLKVAKIFDILELMLKSFRCLRKGGWTTVLCPWRGLLRERLGLVLLVGRWLRQLAFIY